MLAHVSVSAAARVAVKTPAPRRATTTARAMGARAPVRATRGGDDGHRGGMMIDDSMGARLERVGRTRDARAMRTG